MMRLPPDKFFHFYDNSDLCLPRNYSSRDKSQLRYYDDICHDESSHWQPEVYPFAGHIASRLAAPRIVDLGCGTGRGATSLRSISSIIGVDFGNNIKRAQEIYPDYEWLDFNLDNISEQEQILLRPAEGSLLICSDVIEHLNKPLELLSFFRECLPTCYGIVLSTPDRNRARGHADLGPPANPAHIREWCFEELGSLMRRSGLNPLVHGFTRNFSATHTRNTQVAFIPGALSGLTPSKQHPSTLAIVPCYNEVDIIETTIGKLLGQGIDVHCIDNHSTDGTWELINKEFGSLIQIERFPDNPLDYYAWWQILERMDAIASAAPHDWILHVDADEQLEPSISDLSLLDMIAIADSSGFDTLDCTLLDFRPITEKQLELPTMFQFAQRPGAQQLQRGWRNRRSRVGLADTGGHALTVPTRIFPFNLVLRHYPLRSREQAIRKLTIDRGDRLQKERLEKNWHVHYDNYNAEHRFIWDSKALAHWDWDSTREYCVEFSTRVGISFSDYGLPEGFS